MLFHFFSLAFFLLGVSCTKIQSEALPKQEIAGEKSPYRSLSLAVLWLALRAMRLTLPIFSFQPTRFGHVVEGFAVAASSLRSEDSEHVPQVV
jgi:hypothetical protein